MDAEKIAARAVIKIDDGGNDTSDPSVDFREVGVDNDQSSFDKALPETPNFDSVGNTNFLRSSSDGVSSRDDGDRKVREAHSGGGQSGDRGKALMVGEDNSSFADEMATNSSLAL
ncbi:unnamed protein product [Linum trigynum]|uniref:Uncharacterized protein n=1 Tax=Linum trigynum TaxID=586398 RepID=A0AAV2DWK5_9ROSI